MRASTFAYLCAFAPIISVHLTLALAMSFDNLSTCIPYWSHCHSISATGRQYPEFFFFKGLMIPVAILMLGYWLLMRAWLTRLQLMNRQAQVLVTFGVVACIALIIYCVTLGAVGEPYALARRIGVVLFFALTSFAHLLLLARLSKSCYLKQISDFPIRALNVMCIFLLVIGIFSAFLGFLWQGYEDWDNAFEWWFALLMMSQFYLVGRIWDDSKFHISLVTEQSTIK